MTQSDRSEQLLADLWAQDEAPAHDPSFVLAAMERVERRRLIEGILALAPMMAAASLVLWALAPVIASVAARVDAGALGPLAAAAMMALFLWSWASDRLQPLGA
jgi:hypothetical protein